MLADFLSRSFQETCAVTILERLCLGARERYTVQINQRSLAKQMAVSIPNAHLLQKGSRKSQRCSNQKQYPLDQKKLQVSAD